MVAGALHSIPIAGTLAAATARAFAARDAMTTWTGSPTRRPGHLLLRLPQTRRPNQLVLVHSFLDRLLCPSRLAQGDVVADWRRSVGAPWPAIPRVHSGSPGSLLNKC